VTGRLGDDEVCSLTLTVQLKVFYWFDRSIVNTEVDERNLLRRMRQEITAQAKSFAVVKTQIEVALRSEYSLSSDDASAAAEDSNARRVSPKTRILDPRRARNLWRRRRQAIVATATGATHEVRWDEYAQAYDVMCSANPAYQKNLTLFREWIAGLHLPQASTICDVGAGTGNYVLELARRFPDARVIHLDSDPVMNRTASRKYSLSGVENVGFASSNASTVDLAPSSLDLIVCVNALYTFAEPSRVLDNFKLWLKPAGYLFVIDLGRPMDVADWSRYIVTSSVKTIGIGATLKAFFRGRKAIGQNRLIRREQELGRYWLHSPADFRVALINAGFEIGRTQICYRDVCDLAVCRKPTQSHLSTQ
jgi:ubiquinone/menaquinone biosynthesis C-methylase UbiE